MPLEPTHSPGRLAAICSRAGKHGDATELQPHLPHGSDPAMPPAGFTSLPRGVTLSPSGGFLTLLPLEAVACTVLFSPPTPGSHQFELAGQTLLGSSCHVQCTAIGVQPPVQLSHNTIQVSSTAAQQAYQVSVLAWRRHKLAVFLVVIIGDIS